MAKQRLNANVTAEQQEALQAEADRRGISVSELLRRILDAWLDDAKGK